jgi:hypothetical protein
MILPNFKVKVALNFLLNLYNADFISGCPILFLSFSISPSGK